MITAIPGQSHLFPDLAILDEGPNPQVTGPFPNGYETEIQSRITEIQELYCSSSVPCIIGYSGGKDSSAVLLLWAMALSALPKERRTMPVYIFSTDTMVENPIVAAWIHVVHDALRLSAERDGLPWRPEILRPEIEDTYWVSLIGRGYSQVRPGKGNRWCTSRLKLKPSEARLQDIGESYGGHVMVLGTRKAESVARRGRMESDEQAMKNGLVPNRSYRHRGTREVDALVSTPIAAWRDLEVWNFLHRAGDNHLGIDFGADLEILYSASEGDECAFATSERDGCSGGRMGCYTCGMASDESLKSQARTNLYGVGDILSVLAEFGNELRDFERESIPARCWDDGQPIEEITYKSEQGSTGSYRRQADEPLSPRREFRKTRRSIQALDSKRITLEPGVASLWLIRGGYSMAWRHYWMRRVLRMEAEIQSIARTLLSEANHGSMRHRILNALASQHLITDEELDTIRHLWLFNRWDPTDQVEDFCAEVGRVYHGRYIASYMDPHEARIIRQRIVSLIQAAPKGSHADASAVPGGSAIIQAIWADSRAQKGDLAAWEVEEWADRLLELSYRVKDFTSTDHDDLDDPLAAYDRIIAESAMPSEGTSIQRIEALHEAEARAWKNKRGGELTLEFTEPKASYAADAIHANGWGKTWIVHDESVDEVTTFLGVPHGDLQIWDENKGAFIKAHYEYGRLTSDRK